ncbi:hypothetical protein BASA50_001026 [Batrachochytrium salamandrivorans]|uniref:Nucleolar protein 12 n=1 Tax=Batrachochytrium salamandrivorans TaxID=1357716 RepID=A0ABQ8ES50_9FUNG|nr:hypothetical protein BASA62_005113 [Batrachochytrium salamandrivorans]KAH6572650.1 hypothetical protein BASA60_006508 [Batrachochytrium salamandrivorans]KAH6585692.1 hypothetical protein BASA50_001026 [Batrachochytrium salamandrivorans]KAH9273974.1 hypothetical protein BASA83_003609 [Batrachochytrium salamandrivorans]
MGKRSKVTVPSVSMSDSSITTTATTTSKTTTLGKTSSKKKTDKCQSSTPKTTSILGAIGELDPTIASLFSVPVPSAPKLPLVAVEGTPSAAMETAATQDTIEPSNSDEERVVDINADVNADVNVQLPLDSDHSDSTPPADIPQTRREKLKEMIARKSRTIFVGNLSVTVTEKENLRKLKSLFSQFGKIETIRFRSIAFNSKLPRKVAFTSKQFHDKRDSLNAYIVYVLAESVAKALSIHGTVFLEKHLRVDRSETSEQKSHDHKKSIFVGNLAFDISEEALWEFFSDCGDIANVRVIRDRATNVGKGFGYVQFAERSSVSLALKLQDTDLNGRKVRITHSNPTLADGGKPSTTKVVEGNRASRFEKVKPSIGRASKKIKSGPGGAKGSKGTKGAANKNKPKPKAVAAKWAAKAKAFISSEVKSKGRVRS